MIDAEREALIEKMARAIACHDAPNPKDCLASEWCEENWICYVPEATAALAVCRPIIERETRERCARIAEGRYWSSALGTEGIPKAIAAAIRETGDE